jgi:hypothetical protein
MTIALRSGKGLERAWIMLIAASGLAAALPSRAAADERVLVMEPAAVGSSSELATRVGGALRAVVGFREGWQLRATKHSIGEMKRPGGCDESCLEEIATQFDVDLVLYGAVDRPDETYSVVLSLYDARAGQIVDTHFVDLPEDAVRDRALVDRLDAQVSQLAAGLPIHRQGHVERSRRARYAVEGAAEDDARASLRTSPPARLHCPRATAGYSEARTAPLRRAGRSSPWGSSHTPESASSTASS